MADLLGGVCRVLVRRVLLGYYHELHTVLLAAEVRVPRLLHDAHRTERFGPYLPEGHPSLLLEAPVTWVLLYYYIVYSMAMAEPWNTGPNICAHHCRCRWNNRQHCGKDQGEYPEKYSQEWLDARWESAPAIVNILCIYTEKRFWNCINGHFCTENILKLIVILHI